MAQINFKLAAAQMAQITLHNRSSRHRWHRSSLQTQARGTDGIHRLARHKLHATHGTDHLARHKLHDTDGTDRLGRHNLTAQMPQIIPSITALVVQIILQTQSPRHRLAQVIFPFASSRRRWHRKLTLPDTTPAAQIAQTIQAQAHGTDGTDESLRQHLKCMVTMDRSPCQTQLPRHGCSNHPKPNGADSTDHSSRH